MAVEVLDTIRLKLVFDAGTVDGKKLKTSKTYNSISKSATSDGLYGAAKVLASVQNKPLLMVSKLEETVLSE